MIEIKINNLGPIKEANINLSKLNIISGKNGVGKSFFVRMLYGIFSSILDGKEKKKEEIEKLLTKKLRWIFQQSNLGAIVNKHLNQDLHFALKSNRKDILKLSIGKKSKRKLKSFEVNNLEYFLCEKILYIFMPVLFDLETALANYREFYKNNYGVPDIYWDFIRDIRSIGLAEKIELLEVIKEIKKIIGGEFIYKGPKIGTFFKEKSKEYDVKITASGVKIFGVLQMLLERNLLKKNSILILEEPECNLHPEYILKLMELVIILIKFNINIIITTHSAEILRFTEYLINTKKLSNNDISISFFKKEGEISKVISGKDISLIINILEELTEGYYNIVFEEAKRLGD